MSSRDRFVASVESLELRDVPAAAFDTLPIFNFSDPAVLDHVRAIEVLGSTLGRNPNAFMHVGDSNSTPVGGFGAGYLLPLGAAGYNPIASGLGLIHPELLDTLSAYQSGGGTGFNSFLRVSSAAYPGWTAADVLPQLAGEVAATNAGIALVMIGTNDAMLQINSATYQAQLQTLVDTLSSMGVVPVLSTIPENLFSNGAYQGSERRLNQVIADVADANHLPLWNLWRGLVDLPSEGLGFGGVHLSVSPAGGGNFVGASLAYGQNVRNLETLQVLDWFREQVVAASPESVSPQSWAPIGAGQAVYAVGRGEGQGPVVTVHDASTGQQLDQFQAFDPSFTGGVRVAVADVNGDGVPDIVAAAGPGGGPIIKVFDGKDGSLLAGFFAFNAAFRGGVGSVAATDLDGDGKAEVVVGAGAGGGPAVAVFHGGDLSEVQRFFAFDPVFRGGVNVTAGAFAGIGPAVAAGAGVGGGPRVALFTYGSSTPVASFLADDPSYTGGVQVAAGDIAGSGSDRLITGRTTGGAQVRVYDPMAQTELARFTTGSQTGLSGVRLGVARAVKDHLDELLVGNGPGEAVSVTGYTGLSGAGTPLSPHDSGRAYGIFVG